MMEAIGDRMKKYYENPNQHKLTRRIPVIIRADGKAFHSFKKLLTKPFDEQFMLAMQQAAQAVAEEMQGFKAAYIQSDEVSFLLTDYDRLSTEAWFDYKLEKLVSVTAAKMTGFFNHYIGSKIHSEGPACFDARAFNIPKEDVPNYFLWRMLDWKRNSIHMYAQHFFSHAELHGKNQQDMHEMLYKIEKNWATDLDPKCKNGSWMVKDPATGNMTFLYWKEPTWEGCYGLLADKLEPEDEKQHEKRNQ